MDGYALLIIAVAIILYLVSRKTMPRLRSFSYWLLGAGMGLLAGAIGAVMIINSVLP